MRASDRQPVTGAKVSLDGTELTLTTDNKGKFKFPKVSAGQYIIRAEVEGFPVATSTLAARPGRPARRGVRRSGASDAVTLPELKVEESAPARVSPVAEFNRRATSGNGRYITRDYIEKRKPATMMDLLRSIPGVRMECPRQRAGLPAAHGARAAQLRTGLFPGWDPGGCDGVLPHQSARSGRALRSTPVRRRRPPELEGIRSGCGAVAIWTRIGEKPSERKP